ncbi:hypothetical protein HJC23_000767 [Cyclotella cryptica]|uniref:Uncharacterized protein n=1 Tax=Cyclotella cryptica TaxID=29204 RepID=A0ABD3PYQ9_9STRA
MLQLQHHALLCYWVGCCIMFHASLAFQPAHTRKKYSFLRPVPSSSPTALSTTPPRIITNEVDFQDLTVMDVVLFQRRNVDHNGDGSPQQSNGLSCAKLELGAVQETRTVAPLSAWTTESAYTSATNDMMEFVVDEEDMFPGLSSDDIRILQVLDGSVIGYGSRQVGGGKGLGNPHGEESELLYYIDRSVVEGLYDLEIGGGSSLRGVKVDLVVNPSLEHIW